MEVLMSLADPLPERSRLQHHHPKSMNAFKQDMAGLRFEGTTVTGRNRLISIDLLTGKLQARTAPEAAPCYEINLPMAGVHETLETTLMDPELRALSDAAGNDLSLTLWVYMNIRMFRDPYSMKGIKLSPEAAELFEATSELKTLWRNLKSRCK
jgi:hypothetical protein